MKKSKIKKWGNLSVALAFFILAIVQKNFFYGIAGIAFIVFSCDE